MRDRILSIVERYLGRARPSGDENVNLACPFHATKDGQPFGINVTNGVWHCFTCGRAGTLPQLLHELGLDTHTIQVETDGLHQVIKESRQALKLQHEKTWSGMEDPFLAETLLSEAVLAPYRTKCPSNLIQMGFTEQTLQQYEIGYDDNKQRVIYPVRDIYGNLAGVMGGTIHRGTQPKYRPYKGPQLDAQHGLISSDYGPWFDSMYPQYEFHSHRYLWNYSRVYPRLFFGQEDRPVLIIVEGFKAALWLLQHGWWNVVALMGSKLGHHQKQLLIKPATEYVLFLDNDAAGRDGTQQAGSELYNVTSGVFVARYPDGAAGMQPDGLDYAGLCTAIGEATFYPRYREEIEHGTRGIQAGS